MAGKLPLPVLMAEEKWHLAMRDFRQNQVREGGRKRRRRSEEEEEDDGRV